MPVGTILPYVGSMANIPKGWHLCDGTDGTPNLLDGRFLEGDATPGIFKEPGLPNIKGSFYGVKTDSGPIQDGAFRADSSYHTTLGYGNYYMKAYSFAASWSNSIYGASSTVQPRSYTVLYIMKIA